MGELTDVQFNYYVQVWQLDREYVNLLLSDARRAKEIFDHVPFGCLWFLMAVVIVLIIIMLNFLL